MVPCSLQPQRKVLQYGRRLGTQQMIEIHGDVMKKKAQSYFNRKGSRG